MKALFIISIQILPTLSTGEPDILFKNIKVTFADMSRHKADFIIGMDIISRGKLEVFPESGEIIMKFSKISN